MIILEGIAIFVAGMAVGALIMKWVVENALKK